MRLITYTLLFFAMLSLHAQQISNVTFAQEGQEVKVNYDFTGAGNKSYDIMLYYSQDNGSWKGPLKAVSGAVGSNQTGGYAREIRWRASEEVSALSSSNVRFKVSAKPPVDLIPTPDEPQWYEFAAGGLKGRASIKLVKPQILVEEKGSLKFEFVVEPNGSVSYVKLVGVTNKPGLKEAGINAIKKWRFNALEPTQSQVRQVIQVLIMF